MGMLMHGKHAGCGQGTCAGELAVSDVGEKERSQLRGHNPSMAPKCGNRRAGSAHISSKARSKMSKSSRA